MNKDLKIEYIEEQANLPLLNFPYSPTISSFNSSQIPEIYNRGFIAFGNKFKMARSIRVNLMNFSPSKKNRQVLSRVQKFSPQYHIEKKEDAKYIFNENFIMQCIHFSHLRYVDDIFLDREKLLEIINNPLINHVASIYLNEKLRATAFVCQHDSIMHYWHAFYDIEFNLKNRLSLGIHSMLSTIQYAKSNGITYLYLGAAYDIHDYYKVANWNSVEWWTGSSWSKDINKIKSLCGQ